MRLLKLFYVSGVEGRMMVEVKGRMGYGMMDRVMGGIGISDNKRE